MLPSTAVCAGSQDYPCRTGVNGASDLVTALGYPPMATQSYPPSIVLCLGPIHSKESVPTSSKGYRRRPH